MQVLIDGVNVQSFNLQWLRSIMGLVGQDPVVFKGTIMDNILVSKPGSGLCDVSY